MDLGFYSYTNPFLSYDILSLARKPLGLQKYVNRLSLVSYWVELTVCIYSGGVIFLEAV